LKRDLAIRALDMAVALRRPAPGCIHHTDRGSQGGFNRSSQHLDKGECDDYSKATFESVRARSAAITGPASGGAT
jgi:transposase InsO family protein